MRDFRMNKIATDVIINNTQARIVADSEYSIISYYW